MLKTLALCTMGLVVTVSAIVVQDYAVAEAAPSGLDWSFVYNYKGSSAMAVGGSWLLTAAHVAHGGGTGALSVGGDTYNQQEIIFNQSADLALVRYDKAFPGFYPLFTGELVPSDPNPKLSVLMVGFGTTGNVSTNSWTDSGSGSGTKRWGSQMISMAGSYITKPDGVNFVDTEGAYMIFDLGHTAYEAGVGTGDSGGGVFYNDNGTWKVAGVIIGRTGSSGSYTSTFTASMPEYSSWVMETIPEPGTISLMGLSTVGLFLARAKRRRKLAGRSLFATRREVLCDTFRTLEEREAHCRMLEGTGCPTGLTQAIKPRLLAAWNKVHVWYKGLDEMFWSHMVATHERRLARKKAIRSTLRKKALNGLDAFLALVMK